MQGNRSPPAWHVVPRRPFGPVTLVFGTRHSRTDLRVLDFGTAALRHRCSDRKSLVGMDELAGLNSAGGCRAVRMLNCTQCHLQAESRRRLKPDTRANGRDDLSVAAVNGHVRSGRNETCT
jgi:hypothetical protein